MKIWQEFKKGLTIQNPTFGLVLGLCPTLAVSTTVINAIGMGLAASFVLLGSNIIISSLRRIIPQEIRIPCYIVIIATFGTITELLMKAYSPGLSKSLGIFVPLIVVNCIVMVRAEAFASKNSVISSIFDALGMGLGFTLALTIIASIREILGNGTFLGIPLIKNFSPIIVMILAPGALLTIGLLISLTNWLKLRRKEEPLRKVGCCQ
ncbi:MAG: electron transport complex subunit RsxE [Candidatus Omnitrophota bacterium]